MIIARQANANDHNNIFKLLYDIYVLELNQYHENNSKMLIDKNHEYNHYIVVYEDKALIGTVAITLPNTSSISTLNRIPIENPIHKNIDDIAEVRLLSVKYGYRGSYVYNLIIYEIMKFCSVYNINRILISAIEDKISLYRQLGFKPISNKVRENTCIFQPMQLLRNNFEKSRHFRLLKRKFGDKNESIFWYWWNFT